MLDPWVLWLIVGLVLLALELLVPGIVLMFFGLGALLVSLLVGTGVIEEGAMGVQLIVFAIASVILLALLRRVFRKTLSGSSSQGEHLEEFVGREVTVLAAIPDQGEGRVELKGATWRARSAQALPSGARARILRRDGLLLWVEAG